MAQKETWDKSRGSGSSIEPIPIVSFTVTYEDGTEVVLDKDIERVGNIFFKLLKDQELEWKIREEGKTKGRVRVGIVERIKKFFTLE